MLNKTIILITGLWSGILCAQTNISDPIQTLVDPAILDLRLPESASHLRNTDFADYLILAAAENLPVDKNTETIPAIEFKERILTGNKVHKYLGIASVGAALLTILAPKNDSIHENLAKTSAVFGVGAVATGLTFHFEDIGYAGGLKDPDNIHALTSGLGVVGIALAASTGPDVPHASYGSLGTIGMLVGVKYTW